jgi:Holliday junction resolvase
MTHPSRAKGNRFETQCVKELAELGIVAKKVPLSGSLGGEHSHDLVIGGKRVECKTRKRAWTDLFGFLQKGPNYLMIKADRTDTLVVMALSEFAELLRGQE